MSGGAQHVPTPWEWSDVWDNESQFLVWLRGQLRQIWSDYPVKNEFKDSMCETVTPEMRERYGLHRQTKKAGQCVFCGDWFPKSKLEVDHVIGNASMTSMAEIQYYLFHLLCSPDNMQLTCKPDHKIKSYAEKQGISFQEAKLEKSVIQWLKEHSVTEQKELLELAGFEHEEMSNANKRRDCARKLLTPTEG